ncbi:hypothetical protein DFH07DRAFT_956689 [Mycena maculata]|uniref:Uncharacterized protein n=1 Tax=Mycena maculata TaxID=230809 RepID=A0AAD7JGF3_9AGAR|nr:hypothetical protein DFH07DRAFT_956689 [Mycena maculata]
MGEERAEGLLRPPFLQAFPPPKRARRFSPSLLSVDEVTFTFDGAGFLQAVESLAREQNNAETPLPVRESASTSNGPKLSETRPRIANPRRRIAVPPQTATVVNIPPDAAAAATYEAKSRLITTHSALGEILYQTPTLKSTASSNILYETPPSILYDPPATTSPSRIMYETAFSTRGHGRIFYETVQAPVPTVFYSTYGATATTAGMPMPDYSYVPPQRSSGVVFHGRSGPPRRPVGQHRPLASLSPNVRHTPFAYREHFAAPRW